MYRARWSSADKGYQGAVVPYADPDYRALRGDIALAELGRCVMHNLPPKLPQYLPY